MRELMATVAVGIFVIAAYNNAPANVKRELQSWYDNSSRAVNIMPTQVSGEDLKNWMTHAGRPSPAQERTTFEKIEAEMREDAMREWQVHDNSLQREAFFAELKGRACAREQAARAMASWSAKVEGVSVYSIHSELELMLRV